MTSVSHGGTHRSSSLSSLLFSFLLLLHSSTAVDLSLLSPEQRQFRSVVLEALGLSSAPPTTRSPSLPLPTHIWEAFHKAQEEGMDEDSIRLFYPKDMVETNAGLLLSFNLSLDAQAAAREEAVGGDLRVRVKGGGGKARVFLINHAQMTVSRLLDSQSVPREEGGDHDRMVLFDVASALGEGDVVWILVVLPEGSSLAVTPVPSLSSLPLAPRASATLTVAYLDRNDDSSHPKRRKRSASSEERKKERRKGSRKHHHRVGGPKGHCQRHEMYVDFVDLQWTDWILAPAGYQAYRCDGACPLTLTEHHNATNHAIIQGLVSSISPSIPPPCCVPTELDGLRILYKDIDGKLTMKNYPEMIVSSCGCR